MTMSSASNDNAILTHFLQRLHSDITRIETLIHAVHQDVHFLLEAQQISVEDADLILSKVPTVARSPHNEANRHATDNGLRHRSRVSLESNGSGNLNDLNVDAVAPPSYPSLENVIDNVPVTVPRTNCPPAPKRQARALWDYNNEEEPDDLCFEKGAIIEVINENNEDWWTGKCNGRTGIFPSNYVEILQHPLPTWSTVPPAMATKARPPPESAPKYMPYKAGETPSHPLGHKSAQQEDDLQKPSRYTSLKSTTVNSAAANGVGLGAGGIVRAIF